MTLTALDPRTALIVIDLRKGVLPLPLVHPVKDVLGNASRLADAFRATGNRTRNPEHEVLKLGLRVQRSRSTIAPAVNFCS